MSRDAPPAVMALLAGCCCRLLLLPLLSLVPRSSMAMEVMAPATIYALNGTSIRLTCTFNSCYQVEKKQFSLNWTYQRCNNCTEEMFLQFKLKVVPIELNRFGDRIEFTGNPTKNDVSFTLHDVQLEDEGTYHCYVMNPPDRHKGHGKIQLKVITEGRFIQRRFPITFLRECDLSMAKQRGIQVLVSQSPSPAVKLLQYTGSYTSPYLL